MRASPSPTGASSRILVERTGRAPQELLFVDDSARNVEAARAFGIETILYAPGVSLARELAARGLIAD